MSPIEVTVGCEARGDSLNGEISDWCSPTLSSEPVFQVDTLECWQVGCCSAASCVAPAGCKILLSLQWCDADDLLGRCLHILQVDLPEPEDEVGPKRRGGGEGGSVLSQRGEDKQLLELAGRRMQHAER